MCRFDTVIDYQPTDTFDQRECLARAGASYDVNERFLGVGCGSLIVGRLVTFGAWALRCCVGQEDRIQHLLTSDLKFHSVKPGDIVRPVTRRPESPSDCPWQQQLAREHVRSQLLPLTSAIRLDLDSSG
ncbi:Uncharacterised protein [Burkholderia pseudomallei]|nr:Uncharacterised protein [Burkholderia pseudomallei]